MSVEAPDCLADRVLLLMLLLLMTDYAILQGLKSELYKYMVLFILKCVYVCLCNCNINVFQCASSRHPGTVVSFVGLRRRAVSPSLPVPPLLQAVDWQHAALIIHHQSCIIHHSSFTIHHSVPTAQHSSLISGLCFDWRSY